MAPRKRKAEAATAVETAKRVTRSSTRLAVADVEPPKKKKGKIDAEKKEKVKAEKVEEKNDAGEEEKATAAADGNKKTIVIEHCKQCNSFKTRAVQVKNGLENALPGVTVLLNPDKPRRGCFEIREESGEKFITLLDMKRPFKPMKDLDMEKVISDIIDKIK